MILFHCLLGVLLSIHLTKSEDVFATINTRRSVNYVDQNFIGVVIDPMIFLSDLEIGQTTLALAQNLAPALIRFQGPSTPSFTFSLTGPKEERLTVTPPMWINLNKWLKEAGLIPVFALSDVDRVSGQWDAKMVLPLMELSDRMGLECYWEIDNYYPNKTTKQVVNDIDALNHIQEAFPGMIGKWNTNAGDMSKSNFGFEKLKKLISLLNGKVKAMNWNPEPSNTHDILTKYVMTTKPKIPTWTNAPRFPDPTTFTNGLMWAKYLGDAAKQGYTVVFRQPKIREVFEFTPSYLISVLHKQLLGRNVLEMRSSNIMNLESQTYMYAHCAKRQGSYPHKGAVGIFMVNMQETAVNGSIRFIGSPIRNVEVQSYVLTSPDENTSTVLCNGELIDENLSKRLQFTPVTTTTHVGKFLTLPMPPRSVGFFVLPNALSTLCMHEEDLSIYKDGIKADQEKDLPGLNNHQKAMDTLKNIANVNDLYKLLEDELHSNENWYHDTIKRKEWKDLLIKRLKEQREKIENSTNRFEKSNGDLLSKLEAIETKYESSTNATTPDMDENLTMRPAEPEKIMETNEDLKKILNQPNVELPRVQAKREIPASIILEALQPKASEDLSAVAYDYGGLIAGESYYEDPSELGEFDPESFSGSADNEGNQIKELYEDDSTEEELDISIRTKREIAADSHIGANVAVKPDLPVVDLPVVDLPKAAELPKALELPKLVELPKLAELPKLPELPKVAGLEKGNMIEKRKKMMENHQKRMDDLKHKLEERKKLMEARNDVKLGSKLGINLENKLGGKLGSPLEIKLGGNLDHKLGDKLRGNLGGKLGGNLGKLGGNLEGKLGGKLGGNLEGKLGGNLGGNLGKQLEEHKLKMQAHNQEMQQKLKDLAKARQEKLQHIEAKRAKRFALTPSDKSKKVQISYEYLIKTDKNNDLPKTTESTLQDMTCPANFTNNNPLFKEPIVLVIGKPADISQILHDEHKREEKLALLKKRLAFKKMIEEKKAQYLEKLKRDETLGRAIDIRRRRSIFPFLNFKNFNMNDIAKTQDKHLDLNSVNEIPKSDEKSWEDTWFNTIDKEGDVRINIRTESDEEPYKIMIPNLKMVLDMTTSSTTEETTSTTTETTTTTTPAAETTTPASDMTAFPMDRIIFIDPEEDTPQDSTAMHKAGFLNGAIGSMSKLFSNIQDKFMNYTVFLFGDEDKHLH